MIQPIFSSSGRCPGSFVLMFLLFVTSSLATAKDGEAEPVDTDRFATDKIDLVAAVKRFDELAKERSSEELISVPAELLEEALRVGHEFVEEQERVEAKIMEDEKKRLESPESRDTGTSSKYSKYMHVFSARRHNPEAMAESKKAAVNLVARQYLSEKMGVPAEKIANFESRSLSNATTLMESSERQSCDFNTKFRTIDGTCNSNYQFGFGKSNTIFSRLLHANNYRDGVSSIRLAQSGRPLPSPRLVSTTVVVNDTVPDPRVTLLTMQWGQFLDHDLSLTPTFTKSDGSPYECCSTTQTGTNVNPPHSECLPIAVPSNDPVYNPTGDGAVTCMNFIRSTYGNNIDGSSTGIRQQINALTHWIDGSNVYGSTDAQAASLREPSGRMKTTYFNGKEMLPLGGDKCCVPPNPWGGCNAFCFAAGDGRVNEQPLLTIMHTIWVREHNRIWNHLNVVSPGQSPDFYYQHARRIVIAQMQRIIYNEYLPVMIGPEMAAQVMSQEFSYGPWTNPAVYTEFSTAAFRMGHSQLRSFVRLFESDGRKSGDSYLLSDSFDEPARLLKPNFFDNALRGLIQTPAQAVDNCFADDITSQLFKPKGKPLGLDLISLNIQRGRDHGLPPYFWMNYYLTSNYLLQSSTWSFDHLVPRIPQEVVSALKSVYETVYDIDLFIGAVTEKPLPNAVLGPTFAGIFAIQFINSRRSDRFFYNNNVGSFTGFSPAQVAEIEKASLARILCDNSDGTITTIQPKVFRIADDLLNKPVSCNNIPEIDFRKMLPL